MNNAQFYIDLATPFVAPFITYLIARWADRLPRAFLPAICVALGTLANGLATIVIGEADWPKAALLGLAGIGMRELQNQLRKSTGLVTTGEQAEMNAKAEARKDIEASEPK